MLGSHVMQYGDVKIDAEKVELYLGFDPANENVTKPELREPAVAIAPVHAHVPQREADLLHLWHKVLSQHSLEAQGSTCKYSEFLRRNLEGPTKFMVFISNK